MTTILKFLKDVPWWAFVILALLAVIGKSHLEIRNLRADVVRTELLLDRAEAEADTTRLVLQAEAFVFQRRAIQAEVERDSIDVLLQLETMARADLEVVIKALRATASAPVVETPEGVRSASFIGNQTPFHWQVKVDLPPPPSEGTVAVAVTLDPLLLTARVSCGEAPEGRTVLPALVTVEGPPWADVSLSSLTQDPTVCNAHVLEVPGPSWEMPLAGALSGALVGAFTGDDPGVDALVGGALGASLGFLLDMIF